MIACVCVCACVFCIDVSSRHRVIYLKSLKLPSSQVQKGQASHIVAVHVPDATGVLCSSSTIDEMQKARCVWQGSACQWQPPRGGSAQRVAGRGNLRDFRMSGSWKNCRNKRNDRNKWNDRAYCGVRKCSWLVDRRVGSLMTHTSRAPRGRGHVRHAVKKPDQLVRNMGDDRARPRNGQHRDVFSIVRANAGILDAAQWRHY